MENKHCCQKCPQAVVNKCMRPCERWYREIVEVADALEAIGDEK